MPTPTKLAGPLLVASVSLLACGAPEGATTPPPSPKANEDHALWGYLGPGAPSHWGELDPEFTKCTKGQYQSPIDLREIAKADVDALKVDYHADALRILNNGHTVQVNHQAESTLAVGDHTFKLLQYHLHSPSEHTETGAHHELELHMVHKDDAGHFAVVAIFIDEGEDSGDPGLWRHLPTLPDGVEHEYTGESVDPAHLLPPKLTHYQYHGSLTTPPCTETVTWNILDTPVTMSKDRIDHFRELYEANARPVQVRPDWCLAPHVIGDAPEG